jgi:hypothetical protein
MDKLFNGGDRLMYNALVVCGHRKYNDSWDVLDSM